MDEVIQLAEKYGAKNYKPLPVALVKGEGCWVWDTKGTRYLDMLSAYSALNQGHRHPRIVKALAEQAGRITLTSRAFHNDQMGPLFEQLSRLTGFAKVLPMNSGAEAVESAVKVARKWGYTVKGVPADKARIIVCEGNFHGRTTTAVSFSTEPQYRDGFGPFTPGFDFIPYGSVEALERAITKDTVGFLVEPIQGEAGILIPPKGFVSEAYKICKANRVLYMNDEIQTGLGRTGKLFAGDHEGVRGDILIVGKALGGGFYPISAILASDEVMGVLNPGDHGSTFGGNPLACAVARESLAVIVDEKLPERSAKMGDYLLAKLAKIQSPKVKDIRGRGLFVGVELKKEAGPARPACEELMKRGVLAKETHDQVIRFAPPLVIDEQTLDFAVEKLAEVLKA